jgi:DNA-binding NtrC family response regulator
MTTRLAKILVVDGSGAGVSLAANLGSQGYRVIACKRGSEALTLVQQAPPDLVIADLSLPDASGLEILEQLKAIKPEAAFISIAGPETLELAVAALNEGAFAYVTKPVQAATLAATVQEVLEKHPS